MVWVPGFTKPPHWQFNLRSRLFVQKLQSNPMFLTKPFTPGSRHWNLSGLFQVRSTMAVTEPTGWKLCHCPNIYGLGCMCIIRRSVSRDSHWISREMLVLLVLHTSLSSVSSSAQQVRTCWSSRTWCRRTDEKFCRESEDPNISDISDMFPDIQRILSWLVEKMLMT